MLTFFTKKYLGIDISEEQIRTVDGNNNVLLEKTIGDFIRENNIDHDASHGLWTNINIVIKIISFCVERGTKSFSGLHILLAVPPEFNQEGRHVLLELGKIKNINKVYLINSIIAAAASVSSKDIEIVGPDIIVKKIYIISQSNKTYISLLWAGQLVEFTIINKGYKDVDIPDLIDGINDLIKMLPMEVPSSFLSITAMKPFLNEWYKELDGQVFISLPSDEQYRLGLQIDRFSVIYTKYSDRLILEGLTKILKSIAS